jgi:hypothetical protein
MFHLGMVEKLSVVGILCALLGMLAVFGHWPPRPNGGLHRTIGVNLAKQALALCGSTGQVLVITRDTETFRQPALDLLLDAFQKEIRHTLGKPAAVRRLQVDPLRPVEVPPGDFYELIRRSQPGEVLVSLLGSPLLSREQWDRVRPVRAKIVAFCPGSTLDGADLRRFFDTGLLHAAIVSRPFSTHASEHPQPQPRTFDELYLTMTASDPTPPTGPAPSL